MQPLTADIQHAVMALQKGNIIAYPTEAMYGLGCDPFCTSALQRLITLKERPSAKGLIIVADKWERVAALTVPLPSEKYHVIFDSWPGHTTWLFPASERAPRLITGEHHTIAIRISAHPIIQALGKAYRKPIVSTSANKHKQPPCLCADAVHRTFGHSVDCIIEGSIGHALAASRIVNALDGTQIR